MVALQSQLEHADWELQAAVSAAKLGMGDRVEELRRQLQLSREEKAAAEKQTSKLGEQSKQAEDTKVDRMQSELNESMQRADTADQELLKLQITANHVVQLRCGTEQEIESLKTQIMLTQFATVGTESEITKLAKQAIALQQQHEKSTDWYQQQTESAMQQVWGLEQQVLDLQRQLQDHQHSQADEEKAVLSPVIPPSRGSALEPRGDCLHCQQPVTTSQKREKRSRGYIHRECIHAYELESSKRGAVKEARGEATEADHLKLKVAALEDQLGTANDWLEQAVLMATEAKDKAVGLEGHIVVLEGQLEQAGETGAKLQAAHNRWPSSGDAGLSGLQKQLQAVKESWRNVDQCNAVPPLPLAAVAAAQREGQTRQLTDTWVLEASTAAAHPETDDTAELSMLQQPDEARAALQRLEEQRVELNIVQLQRELEEAELEEASALVMAERFKERPNQSVSEPSSSLELQVAELKMKLKHANKQQQEEVRRIYKHGHSGACEELLSNNSIVIIGHQLPQVTQQLADEPGTRSGWSDAASRELERLADVD